MSYLPIVSRPEVENSDAAWPKGIGEVLARCWAADANERPDFGWVVAKLQELKPGFLEC